MGFTFRIQERSEGWRCPAHQPDSGGATRHPGAERTPYAVVAEGRSGRHLLNQGYEVS